MKTERLMSPIFRSYLKRGIRYTTKIDVAKQIAREEGKAPIEFISPKLRVVYLRAYPDLADIPDNAA